MTLGVQKLHISQSVQNVLLKVYQNALFQDRKFNFLSVALISEVRIRTMLILSTIRN
jgi:hypothetical protein